MKKIVLILFAAGLMALASIAAEQSPFNSDIPERYTVKRGDTLWDISDHFLRDPWLWPEIWYVNPQIANPHLIYPGDVIKMVYLDGKPRLTLERSRTVKLSPQVKELPHAEAIDAIPLDAINNFLSRNRVLQEDELEGLPYVVAGSERRLLTGEGDDFYARGEFGDINAYNLYRIGDPYKDPQTGEVLGIRAKDVGAAKLKRVSEDVATMGATRSEEEIRIGDRLLPHEERRIDSIFYPSAPEQQVDGEIMAVEGGLSQVGRLDVVALNLGTREGLEVGNVLAIHKRGEIVKDRVEGGRIKLPDERAGLLMIFRTFEKMSYGLVLEADRPLAVKDLVKTP